MRHLVGSALFALVLASSVARAQDAEPWKEYGKTIRTAQNTQALDDGAFGHDTSLYTGVTQFSASDISIPGNNGLPVELARRFQIEDRTESGYLGGFGNWDIDVPYMEGTFAASQGWVTTAGSSPNRYARCSVQVAPPTGAGSFQPEDVWQGYRVHLPGKGDEELMKSIPGAYSAPADGYAYPWTTESLSRIRCLTSLQNGYAGEGFELVDTSGMRYRFDWPVERTVRSIKKPTMGSVARKRIYLLATRVSDRFGNWVDYSYNADRLVGINSSDGRQISVAYTNGVAASASSAGRTWTYQYTGGNLSQVTNPDGSTWVYSASGVLKAEYVEEVLSGVGLAFCPEPGLGQGHYEYSVKHPAGATGTFVFDLKRHYRASVPWMCSREIAPHVVFNFGGTSLDNFELSVYYTAIAMGLPEDAALGMAKPGENFTEDGSILSDIYEIPGYDRLGHANYFDVFSLGSMTVSGPGLSTAATSYQYGSVDTQAFCYPDTPCIDNAGSSADPDSKWVTVTKPGGDRDMYRYGVLYGKNEGLLLGARTASATTVLREDVRTYVADSEIASQPFSGLSGTPLRTESMLGKVRPLRQATTVQDGASFNRRSMTFDAFARPLVVDRWSAGMFSNYARSDSTEYHDNQAKWVLGQVKKVTNTNTTPNVVLSQVVYDSSTALPLQKYGPGTTALQGNLQTTLTYNSDGTIATVKDGNNNVTALSNWYRGIPRTIQYPATPEAPSGATQMAVVNDSGWITSVTEENGYRTCYGYDAMGRVNLITYPSETQLGVCDGSAWTPTSITFSGGHPAVYGLPVGHWRQTAYTGHARTVTVFDALWRPVVMEKYDGSNTSGTISQVVSRYDANGRLAFQSYPQRNLDPAVINTWANPAVTPNALGSRSFYDALDRVVRVEQDSELGVLASTTQYLAGFQTRVTNPRTLQTTTTYMAYDTPSFDLPITIQGPEGKGTTITRDVFGKPTSLSRSGGGVAATRYYVYQTDQQLCKAIEPETGATVYGYDWAGNLTKSASGLQGYGDLGNCNHPQAWASGRVVDRTYDARNRLTQLLFPDGRGNQSWAYTSDGLPAGVTTYNDPGNSVPVINTYEYNKRRILTAESVSQPGWYTWGIGYGYDANGNLASQTYPTGLAINYAPNALGQATRVYDPTTPVQSYAAYISYYPNGALKQFAYGNGLTHDMSQNARQLPLRVTDGGNALDHEYAYDANANVTAIYDYIIGAPTAQHRYMIYDGLDRLTGTGSAMFGGSDHWHRFTYDALDNLKSWKHAGIKDYAEYVYDAKNQPTNIKNTAGATVVGLSYDVQGNLANKNGEIYNFDYGNRLRGVTGKESYRYDGLGRRVLAWRPGQGNVLSQYSQSGQLLYQHDEPKGKYFQNIYLGGSLVTVVEGNLAGGALIHKYQHTDALGSPVAVTNAAGMVIDRTNYEPYGAAINKPAYDGIGYTGHVMDGATGLTYMQQRYYDPMSGRFLSVDPVTANSGTGANFNRYWYANNNPYRFTDPDGRESACFSTGTGCGLRPYTKEDERNMAIAMGGLAAMVALPFVAWEGTMAVLANPGAFVTATNVAAEAAGVTGTATAGGVALKTTADLLRGAIRQSNGALRVSASVLNAIGNAESRGGKAFSGLTAVTTQSKPATWGGQLTGGAQSVIKYVDPTTGQTKFVVHTVTDAAGKVVHRDFDSVLIKSGQQVVK